LTIAKCGRGLRRDLPNAPGVVYATGAFMRAQPEAVDAFLKLAIATENGSATGPPRRDRPLCAAGSWLR